MRLIDAFRTMGNLLLRLRISMNRRLFCCLARTDYGRGPHDDTLRGRRKGSVSWRAGSVGSMGRRLAGAAASI